MVNLVGHCCVDENYCHLSSIKYVDFQMGGTDGGGQMFFFLQNWTRQKESILKKEKMAYLFCSLQSGL